MTISSEIVNYACSRAVPFTRKELLEYMNANTYNVSAGSIHVLLNRLVETEKLTKVSHGLYSFSGKTQPPYSYTPNSDEYELSKNLKHKFPFVTCCVWKANAITPFMQHIASMSFLLVDVERIAMESVFQYLQELYPKKMILINPSQSDCERYLNMDNIIVVRPLILESPLSCNQGINTPRIEKILVDIVSDKEFDYAGGAELYHIYKNALASVHVNKRTLLRYASRRNKKEKIEQIINLITNDKPNKPVSSLDTGGSRQI